MHRHTAILTTVLLTFCVHSVAPAAVSVIDRRALQRLTTTVESLDRQITQLATIIDAMDLLNDLTGRDEPVNEYKQRLTEALQQTGPSSAEVLQEYHELIAALAPPQADDETPDDFRFPDLGTAITYVTTHYFVRYQGDAQAQEAIERGATAQFNRLLGLRTNAIRAWALAALAHNTVTQQTDRQTALVTALEESSSLREELTALTSATLESVDARLLSNSLYALQLELQAMTAITASPPILDALSTSVLDAAAAP